MEQWDRNDNHWALTPQQQNRDNLKFLDEMIKHNSKIISLQNLEDLKMFPDVFI